MVTAQAGDTFTRMLHAIDARDWDGVRCAFVDTIEMDYSSLFGAPAARVDADTQIAGWRQFAGAFDATQHITGPVIVELTGAGATARTNVRAYHRLQGEPGGDIWMVAGHYKVALVPVDDGWKIGGITLTVFYQEGNLNLPSVARARPASRGPGA
jgi:hypothetical protein